MLVVFLGYSCKQNHTYYHSRDYNILCLHCDTKCMHANDTDTQFKFLPVWLGCFDLLYERSHTSIGDNNNYQAYICSNIYSTRVRVESFYMIASQLIIAIIQSVHVLHIIE